jgi:hypothetical protein
MSEYVDLGISEMINVGRDGLKLHEVDIHEAIRREKLVSRDKDDVVRFSVNVTSDMISEFDRISSITGYSATKITSGALIHGLSVVWDLFEKFIVDIEKVRMKLVCNENESVGMLVNSMNRSMYSVPGSVVRKTVVVPEWVTGHASKIAKTLFVDNSTMYQVCMAYSICTMDDMVGYRKDNIDEIVNRFFLHVGGQDCLFQSLDMTMCHVVGVKDEHRVRFDRFVENNKRVVRCGE